MTSFDDARADFDRWRAGLPPDPFRDDALLGALLDRHVTGDRRRALDALASDFARAVVETVGPRALRYEHRDHLPVPVPYDALGRRVERIEFDPSYHDAGRVVWSSGLLELSATPGRALEQAVLLYLLSWEGEAGHACPATCTIGLARALRRRASAEVAARFLPALATSAYPPARGAQFLTEVQGGSDVGANATLAVDLGDGTFAISGEKWFCSVADADQFLVTARVSDAPGTSGLGCFVVPREIDGRPNGFRLRRLKEKLGTRGLASGEIDFEEARAWPIGPVEEGFRTAVGVLNTSRWMTAVGASGIMWRAESEARAYARARRAFGRPIGEFPAVQRTLAHLGAARAGALALVVELSALEDRLDAGTADEDDVLVHRLLVNLAKFVTTRQATVAVRDAIEILGGNGTIEEFSILPRLYRDAIVYESWEGTHNVLVAQVLHDLARLPLLDALDRRVDAWRGDDPLEVRRRLSVAMTGLRRAAADLDEGAWSGRPLLEELGRLIEVVLLAGVAPARAALLLGESHDERDLVLAALAETA